MQRLFDVSSLPRPTRIRVRPQHHLIPRTIGLPAHRGYAYPARPAARKAFVPLPPLPKSGPEYEDFKVSQELVKAAKKQPAQKKVPSGRLPNLLRPESFNSRPQSGFIEAEAGPSTAIYDPFEVAPQSGKGKGKESEVITKTVDKEGLRRNPVGVQLLSPSLHRQLFPGPPLPKPPVTLLKISQDHLKDNGLSPDGAAILPEISFDMPKLQGGNLRQHFQAIGHMTAEPYLSLAKEFAEVDLPPIPDQWEMSRPGWTRYGVDGTVEAVDDLGDEKLISFDVETLYKISPYAVMATAASPTAWYSWLDPSIFDETPSTEPPGRERWDTRLPGHLPRTLIPLVKGTSNAVVIGHNVGYDRARVAEEHSLERTSTRWLDTLSLHVATRGISSVQRPTWMKHKKAKIEKRDMQTETVSILQDHAELEGDAELLASINEWNSASEADSEVMQKRWEDVTSANSLADVATLHCGYPVDKSVRSRFSDESIKHASQLRPELHDLLTYCANDVRITHDVYKKVFPLYLKSCPHPASFAGILAMGNSFLPVDEKWEEYLKNAESTYQEMNVAVKKALRILAEKLRREGLREGDPWASQLDWTPKKARWADAEDGSPIVTDPTISPANAVEVAPSKTVNNAVFETVVDGVKPHGQIGSTEGVTESQQTSQPKWFGPLAENHTTILSAKNEKLLIPLLLQMSYKTYPVVHLSDHYWCFAVPHDEAANHIMKHGDPVDLAQADVRLEPITATHTIFRISGAGKPRKTKLHGGAVKTLISSGELTSPYVEVFRKLNSAGPDALVDDLWKCAQALKNLGSDNVWGMQLDWSKTIIGSKDLSLPPVSTPIRRSSTPKPPKETFGLWPKWYWDLTGPPSRIPLGELDLTVRKTISPLLLRMQWQNYPLLYSKEYKWMYRVPKADLPILEVKPKGDHLVFDKSGHKIFADDREHFYYRLPHKDGDENVGNPMAKFMLKHIESGILASAAGSDGDNDAAKAASDATNMNVLCSYWISSRERIMDQMVVYNGNQGMILPQVITMGTVTRRAVEATWLTASNAKKNRVGSELKAMVCAPKGYSIVGADVDSEELWISSVMGDAQFGMHGATAIGWMTLEGTKAAGTDLHSKTAKILGTSRDAAKVFNYSRIYGAGMKHAVQLLLQGDASLTQKKAEKLAADLYKATKGNKVRRSKDRGLAPLPHLWHGGSESNLFNTLESVALSDRPSTPALGCGVTRALNKCYLDDGTSYLPSRINWVVQSSGVDYLHLLIVSMEYLIKRYSINARYLISVHDEVRYLAAEKDQYRTALALQIANAWTRALFCFNLGIDDVPQGVAFFSAVDIDHVLRKEVDMTCVTPSHPNAIPAGECLDIIALLEKTGGYLGEASGSDMTEATPDAGPPVAIVPNIRADSHRRYLEAQANKMPAISRRWIDQQPAIAPVLDLPPPQTHFALTSKVMAVKRARPSATKAAS